MQKGKNKGKMKKKIALISDSRCSHSLYIPLLDAISNSADFRYQYIITGMHLSEKFGMTINEIKAQGYTVDHTFPLLLDSDLPENQVRNIAVCIENLTLIFSKDRPDFILAQGDRGVTLAAALVGNHLRIPVVHLQGGDISGTVDEPTRHAITKFAHLHAAASRKSAERIFKMGEESFRIHVVGATGVEYLKKSLSDSNDNQTQLLIKYQVPKEEPFLVVLQHPVSGQEREAGGQMHLTLKAVASFNMKTLVIYPNSDPGYKEIVKVISKHLSQYPHLFTAYKNIPYLDYVAILKNSAGLIGNSSGGIVETPSLGVPTINIGLRQEGREKALNVIDVKHDEKEIILAINKALYDENFKRTVSECKTPYDPYRDGNASGRILKVIRDIKVDDKLLNKKLSY